MPEKQETTLINRGIPSPYFIMIGEKKQENIL